MSGFYYDWLGQPITQAQWVCLFKDERHIADDTIGDAEVSTIYVGLNHALGLDCPPLIFETMIFGGGELDGRCWRYSSERDAREGHAQAVELVHARVRAR